MSHIKVKVTKTDRCRLKSNTDQVFSQFSIKFSFLSLKIEHSADVLPIVIDKTQRDETNTQRRMRRIQKLTSTFPSVEAISLRSYVYSTLLSMNLQTSFFGKSPTPSCNSTPNSNSTPVAHPSSIHAHCRRRSGDTWCKTGADRTSD